MKITYDELSWKLVNLDKTRIVHNPKQIISTLALSLSFYLIGCSDNSQKSEAQALFSTKAEAEKAAKDFNCTGAHKMGEQWMPCKSHDINEDALTRDAHNKHHHKHWCC